MTPSFDLAKTPIESGVTLIEASAGTGKTFTIAGLFLRLIVENRCTVREILVVTFTEAATEELRDRIRRMLAEALVAFTEGGSENSLFTALLSEHTGDLASVRRRLEAAIRGFDEAPIYTIHGFCQRTLKDRAFESGTLFDTELIRDQSKLLQEIADDYWRRQFYTGSSVLLGFALQGRLGPASLLRLLQARVRHPELEFVSSATGKSLSSAQDDLITGFNRVRDLWCASEAEIRAHFGDSQTWGNKPYNRTDEMNVAFAAVADCFGESPAADSFRALEVFTTSSLAEKVSKRSKIAKAPRHPFFDSCEALQPLQVTYRLALLHDFLAYAQRELKRRKQERKLQSFDDLLTRLRDALNGRDTERLANQLRTRYRAALIDEFQDTDPIQYAVFRRAFATESSMLFYIGDPKQAIYGFRGADIFTYLNAKAHATRRYTLTQNWRSEAGLVHAVNTLFRRPNQAFVFDGIDFEPVAARGKADETPLTINGRRPSPLQIWFCRRDTDGKAISSARMEEELPSIVAAEIARTLAGNVRLGERPLRPQDIAVLVMKHRQAAIIQEALQRLNIPSVLHTEASVFESLEAHELQRVLSAIAQPGQERALKAALATELSGVNGSMLDQLSSDETAWQKVFERFHRYHQLWVEAGFMAMFREWLQTDMVRQRLLGHSDGERRLTNLLHLGELLHRAEAERRLAPSGLRQWLADQIHTEDKPDEEAQLRLERDDNAVRIVTIHKSKGLEYPVVFCPFAWRRSDVQSRNAKHTYEEEVCFHEPEPSGKFVRDIGSTKFEENKTLAMVENLAENVRLLYVALTRARHRCTFVWGGFNQAESSALAWLLHQPPGDAVGAPVRLPEHFLSLSDDELLAQLDDLARASVNDQQFTTIEVTELPPAGAASYRPARELIGALQPRTFTGAIERDWRIASFSGLAAGQKPEDPDRDPVAGPEAPNPSTEQPAEGFFAFPAGTKAGTCLHEVFEKIEFTSSDRSRLQTLVGETLRAHGFSAEEWTEIVSDAVERTLHVSLDPGRSDFALAHIPAAERLNELEFYFPIDRISPEIIRAVFRQKLPAAEQAARWIERLDFIPSSGYVKGYIDLVFRFEGRFYLIDWKSNKLGHRVEDYSRDAMQRVMFDELYALQYPLYTVALHRYLQQRIAGYRYEEHFGGVRYLFLRGIDPARPQFGVFQDRPSAELIEHLSRQLGGATPTIP